MDDYKLDEILHIGDSQFLDALQRALIPDAPNPSVEQVPTTVYFVTSNEGNSDLPKRGQAYLHRFLFPAKLQRRHKGRFNGDLE